MSKRIDIALCVTQPSLSDQFHHHRQEWGKSIVDENTYIDDVVIFIENALCTMLRQLSNLQFLEDGSYKLDNTLTDDLVNTYTRQLEILETIERKVLSDVNRFQREKINSSLDILIPTTKFIIGISHKSNMQIPPGD